MRVHCNPHNSEVPIKETDIAIPESAARFPCQCQCSFSDKGQQEGFLILYILPVLFYAHFLIKVQGPTSRKLTIAN